MTACLAPAAIWVRVGWGWAANAARSGSGGSTGRFVFGTTGPGLTGAGTGTGGVTGVGAGAGLGTAGSGVTGAGPGTGVPGIGAGAGLGTAGSGSVGTGAGDFSFDGSGFGSFKSSLVGGGGPFLTSFLADINSHFPPDESNWGSSGLVRLADDSGALLSVRRNEATNNAGLLKKA